MSIVNGIFSSIKYERGTLKTASTYQRCNASELIVILLNIIKFEMDLATLHDIHSIGFWCQSFQCPLHDEYYPNHQYQPYQGEYPPHGGVIVMLHAIDLF